MKRKFISLIVLVAAICCSSLLFFTGCEGDPDVGLTCAGNSEAQPWNYTVNVDFGPTSNIKDEVLKSNEAKSAKFNYYEGTEFTLSDEGVINEVAITGLDTSFAHSSSMYITYKGHTCRVYYTVSAS